MMVGASCCENEQGPSAGTRRLVRVEGKIDYGAKYKEILKENRFNSARKALDAGSCQRAGQSLAALVKMLAAQLCMSHLLLGQRMAFILH